MLTLLAVSILSTIIILPRTLSIIFLYLLSKVTRLLPVPIYPGIYSKLDNTSLSMYLPLITDNG